MRWLLLFFLSFNVYGDALLDAIYGRYLQEEDEEIGYYNEDSSYENDSDYTYDERDNSWRLTPEKELIIIYSNDCE